MATQTNSQLTPELEDVFRQAVELHKQGNFEEARQLYKRVLATYPDHFDALHLSGVVEAQTGNQKGALELIGRAIALNPYDATAYCNYGLACQELGKFDEALISFRRATELKPDYAEAFFNQGNVLRETGQLDEAIVCYRHAIKIKPNFAEVYNNLGNTSLDFCHLEAADAYFQKAIELDQNYFVARSNQLFTLNYHDMFPVDKMLILAKEYGQRTSSRVVQKYRSWKCGLDSEKLRIGFVSGDFSSHPVGYFLENLVAHLDKSKIELVAYPTVLSEDQLTARIKPHFRIWKPLAGKGDRLAAQMIHEDGPHALIDLAGHSAKNRLPIFSFKPAPLQVSWLGYFATTGLQEIDYLLGDPYVTPPDEEWHFTEKVWRFPETYLSSFTPPEKEIAVGPLPAFTNGHVTLGCFNNLRKVNENVIELWAAILKSIDGSRLFIKARQLSEKTIADELQSLFWKYGVSADRLILEGASSRESYFEAYNRVDFSLDPFPYPGGVTSIEGLWMGVPVLTLKGDHFIAHNGETIAWNCGQSDWIASDKEDYVCKAISFSSDLEKLAALRQRLRDRLLHSPLCDAPRFARFFEEAMFQMWDQVKANVAKKVSV